MTGYRIRWYTLVGPFKQEGVSPLLPTLAAAYAAVRERYPSAKFHDENDDVRCTATTPGGRRGRNVAFIEADYEEPELRRSDCDDEQV